MLGSRTPIRVLVVDYGEVLSLPPDPAPFAEMAHLVGAEPGRLMDAYWEHRPAYDRGELDARSYWPLVGESIGATLDEERIVALGGLDLALWSRVDQRMLDWANAIAATGTRVGLLSNMVAEIGAHLRDGLGLFERFASVTYSYEVGSAKPDPRIYHHALASLGAEPHEALLVDDRQPNIEAALGLGMHAHHFHGHDDLVADVGARYLFVRQR